MLLWCTASVLRATEIDAGKYLDRSKPDCGFQFAIDEAAAQGGGVVKLPEGTFELRRGLVLRDKVELVGAGMDRTILTPARRVQAAKVLAVDESRTATLDRVPEGLDVGSGVAITAWPPAWYGAPRPAWVTALDRASKTLRVEAPYGDNLKPGVVVLFGDAAALDKPISTGDTQIRLKNASLFQPGDELAIGEPPNESLLAMAFVKQVQDNTLLLEEPVKIDFAAWPDARTIGNKKVNALLWAVFPMVHAANIKDAAVRDLTCKGHGLEAPYTTQTRYTLSGIHLFNARNVKLERVAVRDWPSDGFSLQTGDACAVIDCEATGNLQNGFHPGTGLTNSLFERCLAERNGEGIYFCWHNRGHVLRGNKVINNKRGGITGLGNPGDRGNTIENNLIAGNGGPGIAINGGQVANNVIRNNIIRDNSAGAPGKHPGIALYAAVEDARNYTIEGNTIESTAAEPTQWVGIEEKHGMRNNKPTTADENTIRNNSFRGHKTADIVYCGENTTIDNGGAKVVKAEPAVAAN